MNLHFSVFLLLALTPSVMGNPEPEPEEPGCGPFPMLDRLGNNPCSRRLETAGVVMKVLDTGEREAYEEACSNHDYALIVYVDTHVYLIATPTDRLGSEAGCAPLAFHSNLKNVTMSKGIEMLESNVPLSEMDAINDDIVSLGDSVYKLEVILGAFDGAEVNAPGMQEFDAVTNDCGDFVLHIGSLLDVKMTSGMTFDIAKSLAKYDKKHVLLNKVGTSDQFRGLDVMWAVANSAVAAKLKKAQGYLKEAQNNGASEVELKMAEAEVFELEKKLAERAELEPILRLVEMRTKTLYV